MSFPVFKPKIVLCVASILAAIASGRLGAGEPSGERSAEDIRAAIASLHVEDVAWRKVQWRTCLLDGLRDSRRLGKPLLLWVFIDRPIDDERC